MYDLKASKSLLCFNVKQLFAPMTLIAGDLTLTQLKFCKVQESLIK